MWNRKCIYRAVSQFFYQNILKYTSEVYNLFYNAPFVATKSRKFSVFQTLREQNHCRKNLKSLLQQWQPHQNMDLFTSLSKIMVGVGFYNFFFSGIPFQTFRWGFLLENWTPLHFSSIFWFFPSDILPWSPDENGIDALLSLAWKADII